MPEWHAHAVLVRWFIGNMYNGKSITQVTRMLVQQEGSIFCSCLPCSRRPTIPSPCTTLRRAESLMCATAFAQTGITGLWRGNLTNCIRVFPHAATQFTVCSRCLEIAMPLTVVGYHRTFAGLTHCNLWICAIRSIFKTNRPTTTLSRSCKRCWTTRTLTQPRLCVEVLPVSRDEILTVCINNCVITLLRSVCRYLQM